MPVLQNTERRASIRRLLSAGALAPVLVAASASPSVQAAERSIDVHRSHVTVFVAKAGIFSAFGDDHTITARIAGGAISETPPLSVRIVVNAGELTVVDPKSDADTRRAVSARMLSGEVLDAAEFPTIVFESTSVERAGENRWEVSGRLTIHGVTRSVTFETTRVNDQYRGEIVIRQHDFGISPIRIAGGAVKVKDELKVEFEVSAA